MSWTVTITHEGRVLHRSREDVAMDRDAVAHALARFGALPPGADVFATRRWIQVGTTLVTGDHAKLLATDAALKPA